MFDSTRPRVALFIMPIMLLRRVAFPAFCEPCLPSPAEKPPTGAGWLHEIKHDGFRVIARKDSERVRLYSRPGNDLTAFHSSSRQGPSWARGHASSMVRPSRAGMTAWRRYRTPPFELLRSADCERG